MKLTEREKWFLDRIGKKVYRNNTHCNDDECKPCLEVYNNGIIVHDKFHASYLHDVETDFTFGGNPMKYFDTIKERDEYETKLND